MRRRDVVAGIGSLGALAGAGSVVRYGLPSIDGGTAAADDDEAEDEVEEWPMEVETIEARGSEAGTMTIPSENVMVLMFFVNGCGNCQAQTGRLADARAQLRDDHGDAVSFLSLTYDSREQIPPDELREWWETHGGNGYLSYDAADPMHEYAAVGYPVTIVIDPDGEEHWRDTGITDGSRIVSAVEDALEATADDAENESAENGTDGAGEPGVDGTAENGSDGAN